jgi:hypothetical protein
MTKVSKEQLVSNVRKANEEKRIVAEKRRREKAQSWAVTKLGDLLKAAR